MNRKNWIIAGILVTIMIVVGTIFLRNNIPDEPIAESQGTPASVLVYCSEEQVRPCVVSFGVDVDGNMLVNFLLPELSFPNFHLKIVRGQSEYEYTCQRVGSSRNNAYCIGQVLPPGTPLHLMLFSTRDETLLAEGDLSIIGLVYPTLGVVSQTPEYAAPAPTEKAITKTPTSSPTPFQKTPVPSLSPTPASPSYPNPSYPNPSYP